MPKKGYKSRSRPVHSAIKSSLGYSADTPDKDVYADWEERKRRVCKPCWELKYCPYGPLVEQSPILPTELKEAEEHISALRVSLERGYTGEIRQITPDEETQYRSWIDDEELLLHQAWNEIRDQARLDAAAERKTDEEKLEAFLNLGGLPPIHIYRVPYELGVAEIREDYFGTELWQLIVVGATKLKENYLRFIDSGQVDTRKPLHLVRRLWLSKSVHDHDPAEHPESIPLTFLEASCSVFGHICPVFFAAEGLTETQEQRRIGRRQPNFATMMRIVRRDDYSCQHCFKRLQDNEVEFDHKIPVSKGGSSEEHNLRLTCFECNRDKSDEYIP